MLALAVLLHGLYAQAPSAFSPLDQADILLQSGETRKALGLLATVPCGASDGPICPARQASLTGIAHLYEGRYQPAAAAFREAMERYRQVGDAPRLINTLNSLGTVHFDRGEYAEAYRLYEAAREQLEGAERQPWYTASQQLTVANVATLQQRLGRYRQALESYQWLGPAPAGLSVAERAQMLGNLAVLNRSLGDPWKARLLLQQALALLESNMHHETWLGVVKNLGIVEALDFGDLAEARRQFEMALGVAERLANARETVQIRLYLAEAHWRMGNAEQALALWRSTLAQSRVLETAEEEWRSQYGLARALRRQGRVGEAVAALAAAMQGIEKIGSGVSAPALRTEFLSDQGEVYEEALDLSVERGDTAGAFRAMERARALQLQEGLRAREVELAAFQARLRADEAALLYRMGRTRGYLLWMTREQAGLRRLDLGESAAAAWINEVRRNPDGSLPALTQLSSALLPVVPSRRRLWIVPDGVLAFLPFELLRAGTQPLFRQFETVYLPFAGYLRAKAEAPGETLRGPWQPSLFAYAGPDVQGTRLLPGDARWAALPQSLAEVRAIARLLPGAAIVRTGGGAAPQALLQEAVRAPVLHLATHGAGDPENADRNRMLLGNGYLFGSQLQPGQLVGVRLAVLSACETDIGTLRRGEGVQSLARSFLLAGAQATVASLWRVDDQATRLFLEEFYRQLNSGQTAAAALRGAKVRFAGTSGALRSPKHWAAFVIQGDGDQVLPRTARWWHLAVCGAAVLALLAWAVSSAF